MGSSPVRQYDYFSHFAGALAIPRALLGAGSGQIWLDDVQCRGTESRLIDCLANPIGTHNCAHSEDVGVRCASKMSVADLEGR